MKMTTSCSVVAITMISALIGCNSAPIGEARPDPVLFEDYILWITDNPQKESVEVKIKSLSERNICMTNSDWPSDEGFIDSASQRVFIEIADKIYPFKNYNMGVCPHKECAISLGPGESLSVELDYRNFYLPLEMYSKEKSVVFQPSPFWCDDGYWLEW